MEKAKELLHKVTPGHKDETTTHGTTHTGPGTSSTHTSGAPVTQPGAHSGPHSSGLANQADPRVDSDRDASRNMGATQTHGTGTTGLTGSHGTTGAHTGTTGTHTGTTGTHTGTTGTTGPHSSNLANKLDPRVDSDRDGSRNMGATQTHGTGSTGLTGSSGTHTGASGVPATQPGSHTGPHSSGFANQADPRVDSDLDASRNMGATQTHGGAHTGLTGSHGTHTGTTGTGLTGSHGTHTGTTGTGLTGSHGTTGTHTGTSGVPVTQPGAHSGPHSSGLANQADPRVDSDRDASRNMGATQTHGTGAHGTHSGTTGTTGSTTAGPHSSNILNKLDPRVDSDRDGSKTVGSS